MAGQRSEPAFKLVERDRDGAGDVARGVLLTRTHVEDDDIAALRPLEQLGAGDGLELPVVFDVALHELLNLGKAGSCEVAESEEEAADLLVGDAMNDLRPLFPHVYEVRGPEHLQVLRGVRHGHPGRSGERLDTALALAEEIEKLDPAGGGERLPDPRELFMEVGVARHSRVFLQRSLE